MAAVATVPAVEASRSTLSMREKAMLKQEINKRHNGNFSAGYVPIFENSLHKTGLRGRKAFLFYGLVVGLFVVSLANLAVTVMLLGVLRIGYGMESLEFLPSGRLLRFLNNADLGTVVPHKGVIGGFKDTDLHIIGESQPVVVRTSVDKQAGRQMSDTAGPSLEVGPDWTVVSNVKEFRVRSPTTGRTIFSTEYQGFQLPKGIPNLSVKEAHVSRLTSAKRDPLIISSPYQILLKGNGGLDMEGHNITWSAGHNIFLRSVNQSLTLDGSNGIRILAAGLPRSENPSSDASYWYKLCVCMPSGRIFRVPVREQGFGCGDVRFPESVNPCT
ncbi:beta-sarcoglycan [Dermacentor silvarum]|uniref:beta-sarcoglycan n=1 Tax=Dermacentor silvarum TaxID=543639 RepID=UPI001899F237|nr:beta-sarcoglycan [Dermacentor silvarum]